MLSTVVLVGVLSLGRTVENGGMKRTGCLSRNLSFLLTNGVLEISKSTRKSTGGRGGGLFVLNLANSNKFLPLPSSLPTQISSLPAFVSDHDFWTHLIEASSIVISK